MSPFTAKVYSYAAATADGHCRTTDTPFCFAAVCHGNARHATRSDADTFALPSPYGRWQVRIVNGASELMARAARVMVVVTHWSQQASQDPFPCPDDACPTRAVEAILPPADTLTPSPSSPEAAQESGSSVAAIAGAAVGASAVLLALSWAAAKRLQGRRTPGEKSGLLGHDAQATAKSWAPGPGEGGTRRTRSTG